MNFTKNGPEVPERLIRAHEDGGVVFFCGAGISFPAGLPGFAGLVDKLYGKIGEQPNGAERVAIDNRQFDTAIGLLEGRIAGSRTTTRKHLAEVLRPNLSSDQAKRTHEALLTLARTRDRYPRTRLVTTNFDRLFELSRQPTLQVYQAPFLPVPKNRWNGLVYLHGLLPEEKNGGGEGVELDQLVLSSGDFGLAYLTDGWVARFVSELFRRYSVCFVGYSINDPVLRYMMDALAADRLLGEDTLPEPFAFSGHRPGEGKQAADEWKAKNVTPILYVEDGGHIHLHQTLHAWAETYRDGLLGKERIIVQEAPSRPMETTAQDDFVGRVVWALSDPSGKPAKRFAELAPPAPVEWLDVLAERRFKREHLSLFGIDTDHVFDEEFAFSLISRPAQAPHSPPMALCQGVCQWDEVEFHLARWLVQHLDEPKVLFWCTNNAQPLHPQFAALVAHRLDDNPPRPAMVKLWRLLLSGRVKSSWHGNFHFGGWRARVAEHGMTLPARLELREVLTPRFRFSESLRPPEYRRPPEEPPAVKELVKWEIVFGADHVGYLLKDLRTSMPSGEGLALLLPDLTALLRDALDLMRELDGATDWKDPTSFWHPSISEHLQNKHYNDCTFLIDLARDAWLDTAEIDKPRAFIEIQNWLTIPYPLFKRLAFFAAQDEHVVAPAQALKWLLIDDHRWLWSSEVVREAIRLMVAIAPKLSSEEAVALQNAILRGPQRFYPDDVDAETVERWAARDTWLRLAKIQASGAKLNNEADQRLEEISVKYPDLQLADDERDEFSVWWFDGGEGRKRVTTRKRRRELADWLHANPKALDACEHDHWRRRCKDEFATISKTLCQLAQGDAWIIDCWYQALQVWSAEPMAKKAYRRLGRLLATAPDDVLKALAHPLSCWLEAVAKDVGRDRGAFFDLVGRVLALHRDEPQCIDDDPVLAAINHPVGNVTQALFAWWHSQGLDDNQEIHEPIRPIFEFLCDPRVAAFRHGRVILAQRAITLFRVDPGWTKDFLLPLFDWSRSAEEARAAWCGFLWTAQAYLPLLAELKSSLVTTVDHYHALGDSRQKYAALLTLAALDPRDWVTRGEIARAVKKLPEDGLLESLRFATRSLKSAHDQAAEYWDHRIKAYLDDVLPKFKTSFTKCVCSEIVKLCAASGERFPDAVETVKDWLPSDIITASDFSLHRLTEAGLCTRHPAEALTLLHAVVDPKRGNGPGPPYLARCLDAIQKADPELKQDDRMRRLRGII